MREWDGFDKMQDLERCGVLKTSEMCVEEEEESQEKDHNFYTRFSFGDAIIWYDSSSLDSWYFIHEGVIMMGLS